MTARSLVARVLVERRRVLLPLGIAALVNLGVYALVVYPLSLKVAASERRAAAARAQLAAAERDEATTRAALQRAEQADTDLQRFYRETLPSSVEGGAAHELREAGEPGRSPRPGHRAAQLRSRHRLSRTPAQAEDQHGAQRRVPRHPRLPPRARDLARVHRHRGRVAQRRRAAQGRRCRWLCRWRRITPERRMAPEHASAARHPGGPGGRPGGRAGLQPRRRPGQRHDGAAGTRRRLPRGPARARRWRRCVWTH